MTMRVLALAVFFLGLCIGPAAAQRIQIPGSEPTPGTPSAPGESPSVWGALAFTADGSFATAWKMPSKAEAEAKVATECARFGRGRCEVIAFPGHLCAALASFAGTQGSRRWRLAFTGAGQTSPEAQQSALERCNSDRRTRRRCQLRIVVCGDGR